MGQEPGPGRAAEFGARDLPAGGGALRRADHLPRWAALSLRWEAAGAGGGLFPVLDADLTLAPYGESATLLALAGVYRPPLGVVGAALDRVVLRRVAQATIGRFVTQVGEAVVKLSAPAQAV